MKLYNLDSVLCIQNINTTLQNMGGRQIEVQEEVESVASDVEDIDEKVEDLEMDTNAIADLSTKIYEATETVERVVFVSTVALSILGVLATTWKYVHKTKNRDSFDEEPKQKPVVKNTDFGESFDLPEPEDHFGME